MPVVVAVGVAVSKDARPFPRPKSEGLCTRELYLTTSPSEFCQTSSLRIALRDAGFTCRESGKFVDFYTDIPCNKELRFEWDENKNEANRKKHGISFEAAIRVFDDPNLLDFIERIEDGEERWNAIGYAAGSLLFLTVVHTYMEKAGEPVARIISARRASRSERKLYAEAIL